MCALWIFLLEGTNKTKISHIKSTRGYEADRSFKKCKNYLNLYLIRVNSNHNSNIRKLIYFYSYIKNKLLIKFSKWVILNFLSQNETKLKFQIINDASNLILLNQKSFKSNVIFVFTTYQNIFNYAKHKFQFLYCFFKPILCCHYYSLCLFFVAIFFFDITN